MTEESSESEARLQDDAAHTTRLRNDALAVIKRFENQLLSAAFDTPDSRLEDEDHGILRPISSLEEDEPSSLPVPEFLEEQKEALREELYESLRHLFLNSKASAGQLSIGFFEAAVYSRVSERIRRTMGFYQALQRAQEEIRRINQDLGDPNALEMPLPVMQKLLSSLDEVDFIRQLGTSLGVFQPDLDRIVENVIAKEFGSLRRSASFEPHED